METQEKTTVFNQKAGAEIDLKVAIEWARNHRERHPGGVISQFFGRDLLEKILQQPDCVGLRFYYANSKPASGWQRFTTKLFPRSEGEKHLIITGVNNDGKDQLPCPARVEAYSLTSSTTTTDVLGEQSAPCPGSPGCPQNALTGA